jgi:preprotein translocase subunit SecD
MRRTVCLLAATCFIGGYAPAWSQDKAPDAPKKSPDGVYAVLREAVKEADVLPLKEGEALVVDHHRYAKAEDKEPARYVVVRSAPDVDLDLAGEPKAVKDGAEVVKILLTLKPKAATALERLTTDRVGRQIAVVIGGEVVTVHKVRDAIKGGEVQITSCTPGAAKYLLEQLQTRQKDK